MLTSRRLWMINTDNNKKNPVATGAIKNSSIRGDNKVLELTQIPCKILHANRKHFFYEKNIGVHI